jgi:hypothetical protein
LRFLCLVEAILGVIGLSNKVELIYEPWATSSSPRSKKGRPAAPASAKLRPMSDSPGSSIKKAGTAPIVGPRTVASSTKTYARPRIVLSPETLAEIDTIFPGHNPSPQGYAW